MDASQGTQYYCGYCTPEEEIGILTIWRKPSEKYQILFIIQL